MQTLLALLLYNTVVNRPYKWFKFIEPDVERGVLTRHITNMKKQKIVVLKMFH
jgi:hypothetical protein